MSEQLVFYPDRRLGLVFHFTLILALLLFGGWGLWQASQASIGPVFLLYLLPVLVSAILTPLLVYRAYALYGAYYVLGRDNIRLRWGLRIEDIPMAVVEWVHPADDLEPEVPLPPLRLPGSILGKRRVPGGGEVEFMASQVRDMLVIATTQNRAYAISPADPGAFLTTYARLVEYGAIRPSTPQSIYPTLLVNRIWRSTLARVLLVTGILTGLILLVVVVLAIPTREQINLGFHPDGSVGVGVPPVRLLLLPVLSWFFILVDDSLGMFFFRNPDNRYLAYILWALSAATPMLFLLGVYFILQLN